MSEFRIFFFNVHNYFRESLRENIEIFANPVGISVESVFVSVSVKSVTTSETTFTLEIQKDIRFSVNPALRNYWVFKI